MTKAPTVRPVWHGSPSLRKLLVPIGLLAPHPDNPRQHDLPTIKASLEALGQQRPIVIVPVGRVNSEFPTIVAGHGTTLAARDLGWTHIAAIESDLADADIARFVLADNRSSDRGSYDNDRLAKLLLEISENGGLDGTGYGRSDLTELLAKLRLRDKQRGDPDAVVDPPAKAKSKAGVVYELGPHRLLCGDSRDPTVLDKLLAGDTAEMVWTDPPYGVAYVGGTIDALTIEGDEINADATYQLATAVLTNARAVTRPGGSIYMAHSDVGGTVFRRAFADSGWRLAQVLIWVKNHFVMGRQDYQWQHEPILYGWHPGAGHRWAGDFSQTTVLDDEEQDLKALNKPALVRLIRDLQNQRNTTVTREDRPSRSPEHPTIKPVRLVARHIANSSRIDDLVLDPFAGAGLDTDRRRAARPSLLRDRERPPLLRRRPAPVRRLRRRARPRAMTLTTSRQAPAITGRAADVVTRETPARTAGVSRPALGEPHESGQVVSVPDGWRYICRCGWHGPVHTHPIDAGFDCTTHAQDPTSFAPDPWLCSVRQPKEGQMTTALTATQAIRKVLEEADGPLKAGAIADLVLPLVPTLKGKTPKATVAAKLYTEAKKPDPWIAKVKDGFVLIADADKGKAKTSDDGPLGDVPATVVRDGRQAKPNPKPKPRTRRTAKA